MDLKNKTEKKTSIPYVNSKYRLDRALIERLFLDKRLNLFYYFIYFLTFIFIMSFSKNKRKWFNFFLPFFFILIL